MKINSPFDNYADVTVIIANWTSGKVDRIVLNLGTLRALTRL